MRYRRVAIAVAAVVAILLLLVICYPRGSVDNSGGEVPVGSVGGQGSGSDKPGGSSVGKVPDEAFQKLPDEASKKLALRLMDLVRPSAATKADWNRAAITPGTLNGGVIPYWTLANVKPVLEAEKNTTAFHVHATCRRSEDGNLVTTVWSNKITNTLLIDWVKGTVTRQDRRIDDGPTFDEMHPDQRTADNPNIGLGDRGGPGIAMRLSRKDGRSFVPYDHTPYRGVVGFISKTYPVAAIPMIRKDNFKLESILVLDPKKGKLLGEICLPPEVTGGRPNFILDQENDALLAADFGLNWFVAVDLRPYVRGK
jgi:hypothetical protein